MNERHMQIIAMFAGMAFVLLFVGLLCFWHIRIKEMNMKSNLTTIISDAEKSEETKKRSKW